MANDVLRLIAWLRFLLRANIESLSARMESFSAGSTSSSSSFSTRRKIIYEACLSPRLSDCDLYTFGN